MLEAALKHQKTFKLMFCELEKGKGVPTFEDWKYAYLILPFLIPLMLLAIFIC